MNAPVAQADISQTNTHRFVIYAPAPLSLDEWQRKYGPQIEDQTVQ
jgi:hypothetical protein